MHHQVHTGAHGAQSHTGEQPGNFLFIALKAQEQCGSYLYGRGGMAGGKAVIALAQRPGADIPGPVISVLLQSVVRSDPQHHWLGDHIGNQRTDDHGK